MSARPRRLPIIEIDLGDGDKAFVNFDNTVGIAIVGSITERTDAFRQAIHPGVLITVTDVNGHSKEYISSDLAAFITASVSDQIARL